METKTQIEIINKSLEYLRKDKGNKLSLCYYIYRSTRDTLSEYAHIPALSNYIPLFTRENAIKYGKASIKRQLEHTAFWWDIDDYRNRRLFLLWIKSQLEEQLKLENKT